MTTKHEYQSAYRLARVIAKNDCYDHPEIKDRAEMRRERDNYHPDTAHILFAMVCEGMYPNIKLARNASQAFFQSRVDYHMAITGRKGEEV